MDSCKVKYPMPEPPKESEESSEEKGGRGGKRGKHPSMVHIIFNCYYKIII